MGGRLRVGQIDYQGVRVGDAATLGAFLAGSEWPFHTGGPVDADAVARKVAAGEYFSESVHTMWINVDGERVGLVKAFDLDDGSPMFDLRIGHRHRGRGIGTAAVSWLVGYLFDLLPAAHRIEGTTRADNAAMRAVFKANGFAKEAHYREAWPAVDGTLHDSIGYAILRRDWRSRSVTPVNWAG